MTIRITSRSSYGAIKEDGQLAKQEEAILFVMKPEWNYSLKELSHLTGIAINAVSGRVNGLKKKYRLIEGEKRHCSITGRTIIPLQLPSAQYDY